MPKMNVSLTDELSEFVAREVGAGHYNSVSEAVSDALRTLRRERDVEEETTDTLRRELAGGLQDLETGEFSTRSVADILEAVLGRA